MTYQPAPQPGGPMTEASVPGLKYSDIVAAQSNPAPAIGPASPWSREQLATAAQAATLPFSPNSPITTPGTGVSSSSGAAETAIGNLGNSINGLTTKPPAPLGPDTTSLTAASAEAQKILKDQQTALEQRRKQAIIDIENSFNQTQASTEQAQKSETGQTGIGLARVGGFDSLSGQGVLTNLAATQRAEISTLQQKRQAAINQAQAAYDDKSFDLAFKLASEVKGLDADIYKRTADYNSALNDAAKEARLQATSNFNMQQALKKDAQDSRDFAYSHGINKSIYQIGNQYYDTATGQQVDPSKITDTNQVQTIDPNSKASADYVANLASKYAA